MFTWICPQCGREVPPAYNDCPDCAERNAKAGTPAAVAPPPATVSAAPPPPPPEQQAPPPVQQQYAPPQHAPQQYAPPPGPPARGISLPVWLMTVVFALAIGGVVLGIVWLMSANRGSAGTGPAPTAAVESPAAKPGARTNALQKHIEVTGVRFVQDAKKKTLVKFVIVNHSEADINGLTGNVTIWGRTQKSEEDAQGTFSFSTNLAPFESKEMTAPLNTKFKIYELPDWQNITTDVQITAPAGGA
jgi:hypothetical protein